ncbi:type II toxin-antitoxin system ParD family antitoxin [Paludibaculum fermentans]|uniref:type II toxin-antitoxin system ParD family antitoxin n=1 Tax=Paludibaculum fermentans TaxID=1473598 RepID=UPI003EB9E157
MPTRNINLTDHFDRLIDAEVGSGRYGNASEVVREGLRLIERRKQEEQAKLKWLRGAVREGLDQIDRGDGVEFGSIGELDQQIDQIGEAASAELARNGDRG